MKDDGDLVFVIDDDAAIRDAIRNLLESVGLKVRTFASGEQFLASPRPDSPSCLVLDVRFPGMSGLEHQAQLATAGIEIPIVFITGHGDIPMTVQAMKAGAVDFLTKPFREQDLLDAIRRGLDLDRERRLHSSELRYLQARYDSLTRREREVMQCVVAGLLNKQIAVELRASETTIKIHRGQVMRKMQAGSLPDLVRMAEKLCIPVQKY